jgi:DHA1 family inner membrane transport protein
MAYFRNRAVNLLNLHYALHSIALYGSGAFFFVYLLRAGVPLPGVLVSIAAILAGRFLIRPGVVPLAVRFGIRPVLIAGTLINAAQFPLLAQVNGVGPELFALCAVASIGDTLYWTTYHAYFAALGDHELRGHQVSIREASVAVIGIVSPLITGWGLVTFGPQAAFGATAIVQLLAAVPLLRTPNVVVARHVPGALKAAIPGVLLFITDGWIASGFIVVWQVGLFTTLGENFLAYGGALAVAALAGAIGGLLLGRHIDAGHGGKVLWLTILALAAAIGFRAGALGHPGLAVAANALGALVVCLYTPILMTAVYNQAKQSPCPLRFHVATEGGWDAGGASACLIIAFLVSHGVPLSAGILLAWLGAGAAFILLRRYYRLNAGAA